MLPVPKQIWAHGWLLMDQRKMSKSKGNVVRAKPIVHVLGSMRCATTCSAKPFSARTATSATTRWSPRYNSDLANGLGNLASRTAAMIDERLAAAKSLGPARSRSRKTKPSLNKSQTAIGEVLEQYDASRLLRALEQIWSLISASRQIPDHRTAVGARRFDADKQRQRRRSLHHRRSSAHRHRAGVSRAAGKHRQIWTLLGQPAAARHVNLESLSWGQLTARHATRQISTIFPAHRQNGSHRED